MKGKNQDLSFNSIKNNRFRFKCYKGIKCFTKCCKDLNLILTPYDILRLKIRLHCSSETFLEDYTETRMDQRSRFPMVYLKMRNDEEKTCPFVSQDGCAVYEDRPGACRIYPVGRAATKPDGKRDTTERFFMVAENHCLGFQEEKEWTIDEWMGNEGMDIYNAMNDQWMEIITSAKDLGPKDHVAQKIKMFYMASYNLDRFREFILKSGFLNRFEVESKVEELANDDIKLMLLAFKWLKFSLFGEKSLKMK
ncbi:MAG: YkgJ family cysteine cluster protein [Deltaproteobacteria bacterium]|nr:YkgJ family cysteine cluster protein [Deltaproteobacteria bacterium]